MSVPARLKKKRQPQNAKEVALNSINCQEAWTFLYRLCRDGEKKKVDPEILASWRAGGPARSKLLSDFVRKVYNKEVDHTTNRARLECFVKLRQASRNWKTTLVGFEWLTVQEMKDKNWSETLNFNSQSLLLYLFVSYFPFCVLLLITVSVCAHIS